MDEREFDIGSGIFRRNRVEIVVKARSCEQRVPIIDRLLRNPSHTPIGNSMSAATVAFSLSNT